MSRVDWVSATAMLHPSSWLAHMREWLGSTATAVKLTPFLIEMVLSTERCCIAGMMRSALLRPSLSNQS